MANPNPSPETRFKPGQSGNPSGRSTEEQLAHKEAARIAAELKLKALSCLQESIEPEEGEEIDLNQVLAKLMNADALRMFKEVEDRAYGTPKQTSEVSGPEGGAIPHKLTVETVVVAPNDKT